MPSPSPSAKLRTKTSYEVRSFQSKAAGVDAGVQAAPAAVVTVAVADGAGDAEAVGGVDGDGVGEVAAQPATTRRHARRGGSRLAGRRTAAVYPRARPPPDPATLDWRA